MGTRKGTATVRQVVMAGIGAFILALIMLCTPGCCTFCKQEPCIPIIVKAPPPPADAFVRPPLAISGITPQTSASETLRAYILTTDQLINRDLYLEMLLSGYK